MKPKLLLVDDDEVIRSQMRWAVEEDYEVLEAEDRASALQVFQQGSPPVILLDLGLPPKAGTPVEGMAALGEIIAMNRMTKVIIITGQSDKANALQAIGQGAYDFLCKPVVIEELKVILRRAFYVALLEREYQEMQQRWNSESFEGMLGASPRMQEVFATIRKVGNSDIPVLILGESGTGKEKAALAIHKQSQRKDGPFVPINCTAIPENLLESELFGHEKGSFTGAHAQRKGRVEMAEGGTLFLDEIGELPMTLQVKLLRYLQEQTIERVGGRSLIKVDARVVAATNTDLTKAMQENRFREDLYYRLAVVVLSLPALRDRAGDVPYLAKAFLRELSARQGKERLEFSPSALRAMDRHTWPGNVRELQNRVKRAVVMAEGRIVSPADLDLAEPPGQTGPRTLKEAREALERELVQESLRRHDGKISRAAEDLGVTRPTFYELLGRLGISNPNVSRR